jgi:hypothetical protein
MVYHVFAQPTAITYQGKLLDASGIPVNQTNLAMSFAMYDASANGNQLWPLTGVVTKLVDVSNGLYSVYLGTGVGDDAPFTTSTPVLSATPASQTVSPAAGNFSFSVSSNTSWTAISNAAWCTVTPAGSGNGTLTATFSQNTGGNRNATITLNATGVTPVDLNLSQLSGELVNFPTGFSASNIILNWTDAPGPVLPTGYLVRMSSTGFSAIVPPVDGVPVADGLNDKNVLYGVQSLTFPNLMPGTTYYFKMFAYAGTGTQIDYKTDGTIPQVQITALP